jgi:transcriptional regulator with XRE-family HTH domain
MVAPGTKAMKAARSRYSTERIGERLREARLGRGFTVNGLARTSGVPASTISKIENGQLRASLVHAINLAQSLKENLGFLIDRYRDRPQPRVVIRAGQRDRLDYPEMGLALEDLSGHFDAGVLEARIGVLDRGARSGVMPMTHSGEEFCYVIDGGIRYRVEDQIIDLQAGDYVQFKCDLRHSWENRHRATTRVLWVFSDGLSF